MNYPKFEQRLRSRMDNALMQTQTTGYGIIMDYNIETNSATVLMSQRGSDQPGEFFANVPCPVQLGLQTVAPEVGRPCVVAFMDDGMNNPIIIDYFNSDFQGIDYVRQYDAENDMPRFMLDM